MNPEIRETLRNELLALVAASGGIGLKPASARVILTACGFDATDLAGLDSELTYLEDKGLCTPKQKLISPENRRWLITASGRDYLAANGLDA